VRSGKQVMQNVWLTIAILIGGMSGASAQDKVKVVESYRYSFQDRIALDVGFSSLPLDAFRKPLQFDLGISTQLSELFTWDLLNVGVTVFNFDTGLKSKIEDDASNSSSMVSVDEGSIRDLSLRFSTRGYLNLLYSKSNWFNRGIVYHLWQVGSGVSYFHMGDSKQVAIDLNIRGRFFLNDDVTFNVTAGHSLGVLNGASRGIMNVGMGFSYAF
jgi:hypothetical protein